MIKGDLVYRRTIAAASGLINGWTPAKVPGLIGYWDAGLKTTLVSSHLSQWNDVGGSANSIVQATAGERPTIEAAGVNGLPDVLFDGTQSMDLPQAILDAVVAGTYAFFMVCSVDNTTDSMTPMSYGDGPNGPLGPILFGGNWVFNYWTAGGIVTAGSLAATTSTILIDVMAAGSSFKAAINSSGLVNAANNAGMASANIGRLGFGAAGGLRLKGKFPYLAAYNAAITNADRDLIRSYLTKRYAIS